MLRVIYACIVEQHDLRLVVLAAFLCLFSCFTTANLFVHAAEAKGRARHIWHTATAFVFGAGVWSTHFVAELAYDPGIPIGYDVGLTALSIVIAMGITWLGVAVALRYNASEIGGGIVGAAVGSMHYIGMAALRMPADLHWNFAYVGVSLAIGIVFAAAALRVLAMGTTLRYRLAATLLLVLVIVGLHFTGMAAAVLELNPYIHVTGQVIAPELLAIAIAAVTVLLVALGLSSAFVDGQLARRAISEADRLARRVEERTAELTRSRENMARAQQVAALGSFERDLVTGNDEWSDELYRILGLKKAHVVPCYDAVFSLVHADDRERFRAATDAGVAGRVTETIEFRIIRPDGAIRIMRRDNGLIFDANQKPIRVYGSYQDVTERRSAEERERELERKLMHSQKLEALGTLAGGIAHDLNNTLMPIMALSKVTARQLEPGSALRENLETIFVASEQARDLVKRVLAFSRQEKIEKKPARLQGIVSEALPLLRATIPTSIQLETRIGEVPPILADASQIHQVITNLVTNAVHAIGSNMGGVITLTLDEVSGLAPRGTIRLSVIDTGEGMDEATQRRIFEPFFTTKQVGQGTGLGLSIIESIVADHGGSIEVQSAPGRGTRFDIYFPLPSAATSAAA